MAESSAASQGGRRGTKSAAAFRTISEVAGGLDIPQHVLRFWESKFSQIKPLKRGGGRRYYRPDDIALLQRIKALLYDDGYTIKGVQKLLREGGSKTSGEAAAAAPAGGRAGGAKAELKAILDELLAAREMLKQAP